VSHSVRHPSTRGAVAAAALALPILLAACGSSGPASSSATTTTRVAAARTTTTAPATTTSTTGAPTTSSTGVTPTWEVQTGKVSGLGTVLVNGQGLTLYMFVPDKQSGTSTCYGQCANAWPPLLVTGGNAPVAGPGVEASLLTTTARTDGTTQVVYNKWPLYTWAGDSGPGQATGQGINSLGGLWYVLSAAGVPITTKG
jgi:predicted lipoprotein with Yx(FWY)xxD motif